MGNITRYDPFGDLDDLFKGFFVRPMVFEGDRPAQIKMDVKEEDKAYLVQAELPGVKKEEIQVTIDGNQVAISAEVKRGKEEKQGEKVLRSERYYGKVYRAFSLGQDVDEGAAQARYEGGVLELKLPKKSATATKKLIID